MMTAPTTIYTVATEADLNAAIASINASSASASDVNFSIVVTGNFSLTSNIAAIDLGTGNTLAIQGAGGGQIDGGGTYQGFVVDSGAVNLSNLSLTNMVAPGGADGGGALYVGAGASVSTIMVSFDGDAAVGAGGAVFVADGGSLNLLNSAIAGSGAGNGLFIAGNETVTLMNSTVTGVIADQSGSDLGAGSASVVVEGDVTLAATNTYTGGTEIEGSLTLAGAAGSGAITFAAPLGEALIVEAGDAPRNQIDGFVASPISGLGNSDTIDLVGIGAPSGYQLGLQNRLTVTGSDGSVTLNLDPTQNYANDTFVLAADGNTGAAAGTTVGVVDPPPPDPNCFCGGTLVRTDRGQRAVEDLAIGDKIVTLAGALCPIRWIGRRTLAARFCDPLRAWPIRVKADALAAGVPSRDLLVSPDHALLIDDLLIHAGALVNGSSIVRETAVAELFSYFHIELENHEVIFAENTPAESFVDNVGRFGFDNSPAHAVLDRGRMAELPYPRAKAQRQVPRALRERLNARGLVLAAGVMSAEREYTEPRRMMPNLAAVA
jgi:Hint domain